MSINKIEIVGGDDLLFNVEFYIDSRPIQFLENDEAVLLIHKDNETDISISAQSYDKNIAYFYISPTISQSLVREDECCSQYQYCIKCRWANGGIHTPIYRQDFIVKRC